MKRVDLPKSVIARICRKERRHKGKILVIEPNSEEYFIGSTQYETLEKARTRFPHELLHVLRIGIPLRLPFSPNEYRATKRLGRRAE